jgi:Asp-tRNA(Asn)/Glu-tRNA(Gln) amidotransferase A subunit family amidase
MDFRRTTLSELARQVRERETSAVELTEHSLAMIEAHDGAINAFVAVDAERALEQAAAVDQLAAAGVDPGPLAGVPLAVKDLEDAAGLKTTQGSRLYADAPAVTADSILVARLRQAGCVVIGKTNTPEFGWTSRTENTLFGLTRNPWNLEHTPGGSSGGSAAALAAGMVPLATGSDGGGSIRIPSAACGLSGFKPSFGRVPDGGPKPPSWLSLSAKGPMTRSVHDLVTALDVAVGPDPSDLASLPRPEASWRQAVIAAHLPARVAWCPTLGYGPIDDEVRAACEDALGVLDELGIEVIELDGPFEEDCVDAWLEIVGACLARSLGPLLDDPRYEELDPVLRLLIEGGRDQRAVTLIEAIDVAHRLNLRLVEAFHSVRLILCPTTAGVAPPNALGGMGLINGVEDINWVRYTYPFNMTRSPVGTVCVGRSSSGVPIGLQVVGPQHADQVVLRAMAALEDAIGFDELCELPPAGI